jgi:hypothetical protein
LTRSRGNPSTHHDFAALETCLVDHTWSLEEIVGLLDNIETATCAV